MGQDAQVQDHDMRELLTRLRDSLPEEERRQVLANLKDAVASSTDVQEVLITVNELASDVPNDGARVVCLAVHDAISQDDNSLSKELRLASNSSQLIQSCALLLSSLNSKRGSEELSIARTLNATLRLLQVTLAKTEEIRLTSIQGTELVQAIVASCNWASRRTAVTLNPARSRRTSNALTSQRQAMGKWNSETQKDPVAVIRKKASSSSLRDGAALSETGGSVTTVGVSEPGGKAPEDGMPNVEVAHRGKRTEELTRSIKARGIACIQAWVQRAPRQLSAHLFTLIADPASTLGFGPMRGLGNQHVGLLLHLLEDDPTLSIRLDAANCLDALVHAASSTGYLQIADERSAKNRSYAFTSLSSRVAGMLVTLRAAVAHTLLHCLATQKPSKLVAAALSIVSTMFEVVDDSRLLEKHRDVLGPALTALSKHEDASISLRAFNLLHEAPLRASKPTPRPSQPPKFDSSDALKNIRSAEDISSKIEAWQVAVEAVKAKAIQPTTLVQDLLDEALDQLKGEDPPLQPIASFLGIISCEIQGEDTDTLLECVDLLLPRVDSSAAQHLATALFTIVPRTARQEAKVERLAEALFTSADPDIQAQSFHAFGAAAQRLKQGTSAPSISLKLASIMLDKFPKMSRDATVQTSWAFANMCEHVPVESNALNWVAWIEYACTFSEMGESVGINGIRACGGVLSKMPVPLSSGTCKRVVEIFLSAAKKGTPKVLWNVAAALERACSNDHFIAQLEEIEQQDELALTLNTTMLISSNFKVQSSGAKALSLMFQRTKLNGKTLDEVQQSLDSVYMKHDARADNMNITGSKLSMMQMSQESLKQLSMQISRLRHMKIT